MKAAPHRVFTAVLAAFAVTSLATLWIATRSPWPAVELVPAPDGLRVTAVEPTTAAAGGLKPGDTVVAVQQRSVSVALAGLLQDPAQQTDERELAEQLARLQQINGMLERAPVWWQRADGSLVRAQASRRTPLRALPLGLWYQLLLAAIGTLTAASVGAFRPDDPATRRLTAGGLALALALLSGAAYHPLALGIDGQLVGRLLILEHLADLLFLICLVSLCWSYPQRAGAAAAVLACTAAIAAIAWLADTLALWPWLPRAFLILRASAYATASAGAAWQYRQLGGGRARERRRWPILAAAALSAAASVMVATDAWAPGLPAAVEPSVRLAIYLLAAIIVYRRALFQIDRWVWNAWVLCGVGAAAFAVDAALAFLVQTRSGTLAVASTAVIAWIYFPLRQYLWRHLSRQSPRSNYRSVLPGLIRELLEQPGERIGLAGWTHVLDGLFAPLHLRRLQRGPPRPALARGGAELHVPAVVDAPPLALGYAEQGHRRFSANDQRLLAGVIELVGYIGGLKSAAFAGAQEERRRLAAELHDRVMPRLLSFIYQADDTASAEAGRQIVRRLRSLIQDLEGSRRQRSDDDRQGVASAS